MTKEQAIKELRDINEGYRILNEGAGLAAQQGLSHEYWESWGNRTSTWLLSRKLKVESEWPWPELAG